jgi:hypothetical protein
MRTELLKEFSLRQGFGPTAHVAVSFYAELLMI